MSAPASPAAKFLREEFSFGIPLVWFDRTAHFAVDADRVATITLYERSGAFPGFEVVLIGKRTGEIARHAFRFNDYLPAGERKDERQAGSKHPWPAEGCSVSFHGWTDGGLKREVEWYIAAPKSTRPICKAIETWIESFK